MTPSSKALHDTYIKYAGTHTPNCPGNDERGLYVSYYQPRSWTSTSQQSLARRNQTIFLEQLTALDNITTSSQRDGGGINGRYVERRKVKGKWEEKVGYHYRSAGGVPTWVDSPDARPSDRLRGAHHRRWVSSGSRYQGGDSGGLRLRACRGPRHLCERQRLCWRRRLLHQAGPQKTGKRSSKGNTVVTATRFFSDGRMRGKVRFFLSCFLFICFFWVWMGRRRKQDSTS
jgi:hypothetical protein